MKKLVLTIFLLSFTRICKADLVPGNGEVDAWIKQPTVYNSEAVYTTSGTCASTNFMDAFLTSDTLRHVNLAGSLYSINVSSIGGNGAFIEVFDGFDSTVTAKRVAYISGTLSRQHLFSTYFSSAIGISNQGSPPACIETIFRFR